ncbi:sensor domain-containing diguanylate cyclase [Arvimicrobium flavum]|uniref:GGDEF domain-containing protein n=1 Tax=Arvimicrobium flavum TaxID=3393320 RepID=UPI00237C0D3D|nr:GGDEF domain-containing protein [Mesorhizobium shangrilense]
MENGLYIALLNPSIAFVLGAAFFVLWLNQREHRHVAVVAAGYAAAAVAFLLQYFTLPAGLLPTRLLSNALFLVAVSCLAGAIIARYGRRVPVAALTVLTGGGFAAVLWFTFVMPDLTWRILTINFALGGIALVAAFELRAVAKKGFIDKVLYGVAILAAFNFLVRTLIVISLDGPYRSDVGFHQSAYWTTVMLSHAVLSVLIAVSLIVSKALSLVEELQAESHTDPLSDLLNRRGFEARAAKALTANRHRGVPMSLVLCDLDHFKVVNDTYGHAAGDRAIMSFADHLRQMAGSGCVLGRIGGEEFAILLPAAGMTAARLFAEGVRASFGGSTIEGLPDRARLTASFGVAVQDGEETLSSMVSRADEALYQAKRNGRDRVKLSTHDGDAALPGRLALAVRSE